MLRWFCDATRLAQLAADNRIGGSTAYRYVHEGIEVLATATPGLRGALLAARAAGHPHVTVDGTLVRTDQVPVPGPTAHGDWPERRVDLWWSGKHIAHGGNVQIIAALDGWPISRSSPTDQPEPSITPSGSSAPAVSGHRARVRSARTGLCWA